MSAECIMHRKLGPPPWYPYRSQEEADKARDEFVDSIVVEIKSREEKQEMSWSVGAIGKAAAMRSEIAQQFVRGGKCVEPEESIRLEAGKLIDKALESITGPFVVKVQASGSQNYKNYSKPEEGICNNLSIAVEIQHNFVE